MRQIIKKNKEWDKMSDKESKFVDTNPENQKPHNISGQNPRSVQTLHKSQVKPRSQDKDIEIEIVENTDTVYKTKTTYLVQKAKMQLKRRVAPGVSEIIIRKNEEKRKLAEEQAKKEAEAKAAEEQAANEELEAKVQKEIEKQDEKIAQRKGVQEEADVEVEPVEDVVDEEIEETTTETTSTKTNLSSDGKSFTQTLREQGLIYGQKIVDAVEKAKPEIEATIEDAKKIVDIEAEKAKNEPSSEGKSFTQMLREQGFIEGQKIIQAIEKAKPEIEATIKEAKTTVEKVVEEATAPKETETKQEETTTDGKSFTQTLREQGFIQTGTETTQAPKQETTKAKEEKVEEVSKPVETKKEDDSSNGEVKTFIDLIRSEGLL